MVIHKRLADDSTLGCPLAKRFASHPQLLDVAGTILTEQWQQRHLSSRHDPLGLFLVTAGPSPHKPWVRPLQNVLVERYCKRAALNLTSGEDFLSSRNDSDPRWTVELDLHAVEVLLNECGPWLIESFQQALVAFWSSTDSAGQSPWNWHAHYLQEQMKIAIDAGVQEHCLSRPAAALAHLVQAYPRRDQQTSWANSNTITVSNLQVDLSSASRMDPNLASALLIERTEDAPGHSITLLYTLTGRLLTFDSRQQLLDIIGDHWPRRLVALTPQLLLSETSSHVFEAQALGLLNQQLGLIKSASATYASQRRAGALSRTLDRMTSLLEFCTISEQDSYKRIFAHLPTWLRAAPAKLHMRYAAMLTDIAEAHFTAQGKGWLDGIASAEDFALENIAQRIETDHPQSNVDLRDLRVVNHQVTAAALPVAGSPIVDHTVQNVSFSLAQLAIANLGLLQPGSVTLESQRGQTVPSWFDEPYLRRVITDVDIGANYPRMLRQRLLDDPAQTSERQHLLMSYLRTQLPAQAMELHLRGQGLSIQGVDAVSQALAPEPGEEQPRWILRPLGFKRRVDATPDLPLNAWLIESESPSSTLCLLYRPLHPEPLLEFANRPALFAAISTPGPLQDDLLHRLPEVDRRVYAYGGFLEPHLFFALDDTSSVPFSRPAPAIITRQMPVIDFGQTLYRACVEETIGNFREQAFSSAQTRWQRWENLGWLLLNTLLPFADGAVARAAWLMQMDIALAGLITDQPRKDLPEQVDALITLLTNIAILLFTHAVERLGLERASLESTSGPIPAKETPDEQPRTPAVPAVLGAAGFARELDFNWSRPDQHLTAAQHETLQKLQAPLSLETLGAPVPSGPWQGLYLHQENLWAHIEGKVYSVVYDPVQAQPRILNRVDGEPLGPWLIRDEAGRWRLDLRLRLRGGQPLHSRLSQLKVSNETSVAHLDAQLKHDNEYSKTQRAYLEKIAQLASAEAPEPILRNYLEKTKAFAIFWEEHLERLKQRNEKAVLKDYKILRAFALHQRLRSLQATHATLHKLYTPRRKQFIEFHKVNEQGYELTPADERALKERLDVLAPLLDQLLSNSEQVHATHDQLKRLASRSQPRINELLATSERLWSTLPNPRGWRYLRMETSINRLSLIHQLDDEARYWIDRAWMNLNLGMSQHVQLENLPQTSDEAMSRLLRSIAQQFSAGERQLGNLQERLNSPAARAELKILQDDLAYFMRCLDEELAEYPYAPPAATVQQLRSQLPGLIETAEDGLLLGQPRADDNHLVDIPGPDPHASTRTYRLDQGQWVPVRDTPAVKPANTGHKLSLLLKDSNRLIAAARRELESLQARNLASYLPVEIEEILQNQAGVLSTQRNAIEQRLTADNQTDEATRHQDAAVTIKALEDMALTLEDQALALRIQAALAQKPRMSELQFLLGKGKLRIRAEGTRRPLAKVKGRPVDYLDEYAVLHEGRPLWYAHFHYRAHDSDKSAFTAGHLKTANQRYAQGSVISDPVTGQVTAVYRAPITLAAAQAVFFSL